MEITAGQTYILHVNLTLILYNLYLFFIILTLLYRKLN